jgi:hypothetical protein
MATRHNVRVHVGDDPRLGLRVLLPGALAIREYRVMSA